MLIVLFYLWQVSQGVWDFSYWHGFFAVLIDMLVTRIPFAKNCLAQVNWKLENRNGCGCK